MIFKFSIAFIRDFIVLQKFNYHLYMNLRILNINTKLFSMPIMSSVWSLFEETLARMTKFV